MAFDFPASPTVGQAFNGWVWDGEKWQVQGSAAQGAVRYDIAQGLTAAQQTQARTNIYAAPFDALAYSGMQINGSMEVSQEKGTAGTTTFNSYACDGWVLSMNGTTMAVAASQQTQPYFPGPPWYLSLLVTTAQAALNTGDYLNLSQPIEGYRIARLAWGTANAQPITIGFWSMHGRTGLYSISICTPSGSRSCVMTYTQAVADVAQYNVVTFPGCTDGTWATNNTVGLSVRFNFGAGASLTAPAAGTWYAANYLAAPGQVNAASTTNFSRLSVVVVLPGIEAPSAARSPLIMRPFDQELVTCQRYYWRAVASTGGSGLIATPSFGGFLQFPVLMRAVPTLGATGGTLSNATSAVIDNASTAGFRMHAQPLGTTSPWFWDNATFWADARL